MNPPVYLTTHEAAMYLRYQGRFAHQSAWKLITRCGVPVYRRSGRRILVRQDDLDELIETGQCVEGMARRVRELRHEAKKASKQCLTLITSTAASDT